MKRYILASFIVLGFLVLTFISLNLVDTALDPEVAVMLDTIPKPTEKEVRAYTFILGITAPIGESPEEVGKARMAKDIENTKNKENLTLKDVASVHNFSPPEMPVDVCKKEIAF